MKGANKLYKLMVYLTVSVSYIVERQTNHGKVLNTLHKAEMICFLIMTTMNNKCIDIKKMLMAMANVPSIYEFFPRKKSGRLLKGPFSQCSPCLFDTFKSRVRQGPEITTFYVQYFWFISQSE